MITTWMKVLHHLLAGVGHVLVCRDDSLETQINALNFTYGVHGWHHQLEKQETVVRKNTEGESCWDRVEKKTPVWLPGRGDGLSSDHIRAAECAGTGSILWAPVQDGRKVGRSRASSASCRPGGTLQRQSTTCTVRYREHQQTAIEIKKKPLKNMWKTNRTLYFLLLLVS